MAVILSEHAAVQISTRGPLAGFEVSDVVAAVSAVEGKARKKILRGAAEVLVVVKTVRGTVTLQDGTVGVFLPDGSNGQVVLAAVGLDAAGHVLVKTVMLQRRQQVEGKNRNGENVYL